MSEVEIAEVPLVDLVAEIVTRDGVQVARGTTVDVIIVPRRYP